MNIRQIGWMYQWDMIRGGFTRPLFWTEFQKWQRELLPYGWSIIREPEEGADESDYEKLLSYTKAQKERNG